MTFTQASSAKKYIEIKSLDVIYDLPNYGKIGSLRDSFVRLIENPFSVLSSGPEKFHLLKDINLSIHEGDRIGLLGVNGCGKTTLCRHIAGIGTKKHIQVFGEVKAIFDTGIGVIPDLTGKENARLLAELIYFDQSKEEKIKIVEEALVFSELGSFINTPFKNYSKGMKARLFLSVISARPSEILILDEVFDGADVFFNEKITNRVTSMIKQSGCVIFVSHSMEKLLDVCNRGVVINDGRIVFDGEIKHSVSYFLRHCRPKQ